MTKTKPDLERIKEEVMGWVKQRVHGGWDDPAAITEEAVRLAIQKTLEAQHLGLEELKKDYEHDLSLQLELERQRHLEGVKKLRKSIERLRTISKSIGKEGLLIDRGLDLAEGQIEKLLSSEETGS